MDNIEAQDDDYDYGSRLLSKVIGNHDSDIYGGVNIERMTEILLLISFQLLRNN